MNEIIVAVVGPASAIGGTILGVVVQHQLTRRHSKASRLHDSRIALYADVYTDLHITSRWVDTITHDDRDYSGTRPDRAAIGGRMLLLGSPAAQRAWQEYEDSEHDVWFYIREEGIGFNGPDERIDPTHPVIVRLRDAVAGMHEAVRADLA
ncbi:hypothetical protein AB0J14_05150 [Micromonospora arborensis]|uniref:hypothetical protein n=1 Tax=Micromonospora arborensis TaxID=2116518 RepID=UPI0033C09484